MSKSHCFSFGSSSYRQEPCVYGSLVPQEPPSRIPDDKDVDLWNHAGG
jgi:hypothetical protein